MIAYSFAPRFADDVEALIKLQTVRADRKRHARMGEPVQLYAGMRTKQCRKLVDPDPICTSVRPIRISEWGIDIDEVNGMWRSMTEVERDQFAVRDGFADWAEMRAWWVKTHGERSFKGVVIKWEPKA